MPDAQIFLFGSRIRNNYHKDSDYDLLIISGESMQVTEQLNWQSKIRKALVWALDTPFDVILKNKEEVALYRNSRGHIIYYALNEALEI